MRRVSCANQKPDHRAAMTEVHIYLKTTCKFLCEQWNSFCLLWTPLHLLINSYSLSHTCSVEAMGEIFSPQSVRVKKNTLCITAPLLKLSRKHWGIFTLKHHWKTPGWVCLTGGAAAGLFPSSHTLRKDGVERGAITAINTCFKSTHCHVEVVLRQKWKRESLSFNNRLLLWTRSVELKRHLPGTEALRKDRKINVSETLWTPLHQISSFCLWI